MLTVFYSPKGGCAAAVLAAINGAKKTINLLMYLLDSKDITAALVTAAARGVKVVCIFDGKDAALSYSTVPSLYGTKVQVYLDSKHAIMHSKVLLVDGKQILTGSYNYTNGAEKENAENLLVITRSPATVVSYQANFALHLAHSILHP